MEIFVVLFLYLLALKFYIKNSSQKNRALLSILAGFGLWIILALRSPYCGIDLVTGVDGSANYLNQFITASDYSFTQIVRGSLSYFSSVEVGWVLYCKLLSLFSTNFQVFLAITALIQMGLIGFVFYKYSKDIALSYIVYFCFGLYIMSFSGIRQSTAIALTFFSFHLLLSNKKWQFFLTVFIASSIHTSALIFLIAYPLKKIRMDAKKSIFALVGILFSIPFLSAIGNFLIPLLFGGRYINFEGEGGAINRFIIYVVIFLSSLNIKINNQQNNLYRSMILMAVAGQSLGIIGNAHVTRIAYYFSIVFSMLFPELLASYSSKKERTTLFTVTSLLFFAFFYLTNKGGYLNVVPYYFFWERPFFY